MLTSKPAQNFSMFIHKARLHQKMYFPQLIWNGSKLHKDKNLRGY